MIKLSEKDGYIERVRVMVPKCEKGNMIVTDRFAPEGKKVIEGVPLT